MARTGGGGERPQCAESRRLRAPNSKPGRTIPRADGLSITHIFDLQGGTKGDVVQPGEAAPHDDVARWWILGAGEIAAEPGDFGEIERERPGGGRIGGRIGDQAIKDVRLQPGQHQGRFEIRLDPVEHRQPEHAPAQDAEHREQPDQPLGGSQPRLFGPAARFQDLVKDLDFPAHGVPLQLLHGGSVPVDRQVGDQLPVDAGAPDRLPRLPSVQHREHERRIALLFGDRLPDGYPAVGDFDLRGAEFALVVTDGDPVQPPDLLLGHDRCHRAGAVLGQPVGTAPDEEVGVQLPCQTEQLPDVALAVADVNAACGIAQQFGGLAQVVQPAHALLALNRHARRIDLPPEGVGALELLPGPEPGRGHSQRQTVRGRRQARMHQQPAHRVHALTAGFVLAAAHLCGEAHRFGAFALPGKLRRVMKNEDRAVAGGEPAPRCVEMAPKNLFFAHPVVGEEAVGRLRVRPVLAGQRNALPEPGIHTRDQLAKAAVQPTVAEAAARKFLVKPSILHDPHLSPSIRCWTSNHVLLQKRNKLWQRPDKPTRCG